MPQHKPILSVGAYPELLSLRHAVLRSAGFDVISSLDPEDAYTRIQPASLGLMLLCYSLSRSDRQRLAHRFRECCPTGRIVSITNEKPEQSAIFGDVVFYGIEGAEALIETVRRELNRSSVVA
jgi:DNA-binding response OmpR family regulator